MTYVRRRRSQWRHARFSRSVFAAMFTAAATGDYRGSREEVDMYIGIGTVLLIILIVLLVLYVL
jgi:hypothetical protein